MQSSHLVTIGGTGSPLVRIAPQKGANVVSIEWPAGTEWLAQGEAAPTLDPHDYVTSGLVGYDDCFPSIAPCFGARQVPDHGELWWRPWDVTSVMPDAVTLTCATGWSGVEARRTVRSGGSTVEMELSLHNPTHDYVPYLWAGHLLLSVATGALVEGLGAGSPTAEFSNTSQSTWDNDNGWDTSRGQLEWSRVAPMTYSKLFNPMPQGGVTVSKPSGQVQITCPSVDWLGLWVNKGGYPEAAPLEHLGIEPSTSNTDSLETAEQLGTNAVIPPGGTATHVITLSFGEVDICDR